MSAVSLYKISRTGASGLTTFGVGVHPDALLELVRVAHPVQQVPLHWGRFNMVSIMGPNLCVSRYEKKSRNLKAALVILKPGSKRHIEI